MVERSRPRSLGGLKDSAVVLISTMLMAITGVAMQGCLAWFLGPEKRGAFAVCFLFASAMATVFLFGSDRAIQYAHISGRISIRQAVHGAVLATAIGSATAGLSGLLLIESGLTFFNKAPTSSLRLSLTLVPTFALTTSFGLLLAARRRFIYGGITDVVGATARLVLVLLLVGIIGLEVDGALVALLAAGTMTWLLQSRGLQDPTVRGRRWPTWRDWRHVLFYSARYLIAALGTIVDVRIVIILLAFLATQREIGLFAAASILMGRLLMIPNAVNRALFPRVGVDAQGRPELVEQVCRASLIIVGACAMALALLSKQIVPLLLSPAFAPSIPLIWILTPGVIARAATRPMTVYFVGVNRPGVVSLATTAHLICGVVVLFSLYGTMGLPAAAWSETVGSLAGALVLGVAYRLTSRRGFRRTWLWQPADAELVRDLVFAWNRKKRARGTSG